MDVLMPQLGETVRSGVVSRWYRKPGEPVRPDEALFEVETEKVTTDIPAPASGVLAEILVPEGEKVAVGTRLAVIRVAGEAAGRSAPAPPAAGAPAPPATSMSRSMPASTEATAGPGPRGGESKLSPVVRRLLAEHGIEPAAVAGTGAEGRITRDDVLAQVARRAAPPPPADDRTVVPMSRIRRLTAAHMARSAATSPHVLQAVEVDFSAVEAARSRQGEAFRARAGFSLTALPFVARAVCEGLAAFPHVNASVSGDDLVLHRRVHLSIAVDLGLEGLVAPVVRDAAALGLRELAVQIHALAERARRGGLRPDDLAGGTYTISNSGAFGTLLTAPIIHQPQVAILSLDAIRKRPVVVAGPGGDRVEIRPVGVLAQCFDHRAFDGAYSASFLRRVKEIVEGRDWTGELARGDAGREEHR